MREGEWELHLRAWVVVKSMAVASLHFRTNRRV